MSPTSKNIPLDGFDLLEVVEFKRPVLQDACRAPEVEVKRDLVAFFLGASFWVLWHSYMDYIWKVQHVIVFFFFFSQLPFDVPWVLSPFG